MHYSVHWWSRCGVCCCLITVILITAVKLQHWSLCLFYSFAYNIKFHEPIKGLADIKFNIYSSQHTRKIGVSIAKVWVSNSIIGLTFGKLIFFEQSHPAFLILKLGIYVNLLILSFIPFRSQVVIPSKSLIHS